MSLHCHRIISSLPLLFSKTLSLFPSSPPSLGVPPSLGFISRLITTATVLMGGVLSQSALFPILLLHIPQGRSNPPFYLFLLEAVSFVFLVSCTVITCNVQYMSHVFWWLETCNNFVCHFLFVLFVSSFYVC